jgi:signal transduction histidine kinase
MKLTIRSKLLTGFVSLIVIFGTSLLINLRLSNEVVRNFRYLANSEAIIRNSNILHKNIIEMQSGYRGYLLTGQDAFLEPYDRALKVIPSLFRDLRALTTSADQKKRLDSIGVLHQTWVEYATSLITTKQDTLPEASAKYRELFEKKVKNYVGKKLNDQITAIEDRFDGYEYRVRQERRIKLQKSIEETGKINLALTIISILLALLSSVYITRIITRRISKMVDIAEEISRGNFTAVDDSQRDELKRLSESLNRMSQTLERNFNDLKKKNKDLDDFAYVVSHDLKAPLRGIDNIITWMEEDHAKDLTAPVKENIELIKGRARRLENMINGLLAYARIGRTPQEAENVDLNLMVKELVEVLVPPHFDVTIDQLPVIKTPRLLIEQVFSNLISNAVKYNDKKRGEIRISAKEAGELYEFAVSDNGIGIQSEYFGKIFMIFQTLRERDAFESTGVGLAIVKRIIEEQKTSIRVESEPGKGTTFWFTWHKY